MQELKNEGKSSHAIQVTKPRRSSFKNTVLWVVVRPLHMDNYSVAPLAHREDILGSLAYAVLSLKRS